MNPAPEVKATKEVVKTEGFYPFTVEELPELSGLVEKETYVFECSVGEGNDERFLLSLAIDLLNDLDRIRKLKGSLPKVGSGIISTLDLSESFLEIVKEWLEENGGRGNLLQITEALLSNGHDKIAELLEQLFLRYSLPMSAKDDEGRDNNVYSLSRNLVGASGSKVNSAAERALQNSVILEEVFKKLQPKEQKAFRQVTSIWNKETLSFWRRSAPLRIEVLARDSDTGGSEKKGIAMSSYMDMVELDRKLQMRKCNKDEESGSNYDLFKHPFRRYQLSYKDYDYNYGKAPRTVTSLFSRPVENNFWNICGPQIEDLQIADATFEILWEGNESLYKTCEMLLLDTCPSLKKLKISNSCHTMHIPPTRQTPGIKQDRRKAFVKKQNFAGNLHTLNIGVPTDEMEKLLFICPNLKTLVFDVKEDKGMTGLVQPTATGEYIKLETLKINYSYYQNHRFAPLREYAELLANKQFNSLKHLSLHGFPLIDARNPPFGLYAALAHFSSTLKSLNLTILVLQYYDLEGERKWFTGLSSFSFPNLTMLKLYFDFPQWGLDVQKKNIKFDFRTLQGMRMLEQLEIKVGKNDVRNPGTQDWICEGDRTSYLPSGVDFALNTDTDPILCTNLKEFTFIGWGLNKEDITILSSWFPNLIKLDAEVKPDAVPVLLDNWSKLDKIDIKTYKLISLLQLRPMKEKIKHLRVIQTISWSNGRTKRVELKEDNGMLYFSEHDK